MKSKKAQPVTGLDIGSYSVKCVEVVLMDAGIQLRRAVTVPVGQESDLKGILKNLELKPADHVRVALSGPSVITRFISMPILSPKELQSAIRFEAENHIPFPIDDCVLDYQVLKQEAATRQIKIMLVAAKREYVESRYKLLSDSGIHPEVIDLDVFCLVNAFEILNPEGPETSYGLLNVGHQVSSLAIVHEGLAAFAREIPQGGLQVTKALAEIKNMPEAQADEMKINKPESEMENLKVATRKGFESLTEEICHSIDFVENELKGELKKVYVSGGGSLAAGAFEILAEEIGRPLVFWDNTKKMQMSGNIDGPWIQEHAAQLNVALGMAIRGVGNGKK